MQKNQKPSISVVIPNYNGRQLLQQNLPLLFAALRASGCVFEVIISDDASTDDSVAFISNEYPEIVIVTNQQNAGFSTNINRGIVKAKLQLVLLLNSDIRLSEDYFEHQLKYFDHTDTFGVMGLILNQEDDSIAEACKYPRHSFLKVNHFKNINIESDQDIYTLYLSGANALVDREKLIELNGFNELFSPFYQEDLDLSLRAWESNYKCYYQPAAICRHAVSATIKKHSTKKKVKQISTRNKIMLHYFHHRGFRLYLYLATVYTSLLYRWAIGQFYYYPSVLQFSKKLPALLNSKRGFIGTAINKKQYTPYIEVNKNVKHYLDNLLNSIK